MNRPRLTRRALRRAGGSSVAQFSLPQCRWVPRRRGCERPLPPAHLGPIGRGVHDALHSDELGFVRRQATADRLLVYKCRRTSSRTTSPGSARYLLGSVDGLLDHPLRPLMSSSPGQETSRMSARPGYSSTGISMSSSRRPRGGCSRTPPATWLIQLPAARVNDVPPSELTGSRGPGRWSADRR